MNWKPIISDLEQSMTHKQIADECGMTGGSHVSNLKNGVQKTCAYEIGCKLVDLHRRVMRERAKADSKAAALSNKPALVRR